MAISVARPVRQQFAMVCAARARAPRLGTVAFRQVTRAVTIIVAPRLTNVATVNAATFTRNVIRPLERAGLRRLRLGQFPLVGRAGQLALDSVVLPASSAAVRVVVICL